MNVVDFSTHIHSFCLITIITTFDQLSDLNKVCLLVISYCTCTQYSMLFCATASLYQCTEVILFIMCECSSYMVASVHTWVGVTRLTRPSLCSDETCWDSSAWTLCTITSRKIKENERGFYSRIIDGRMYIGSETETCVRWSCYSVLITDNKGDNE